MQKVYMLFLTLSVMAGFSGRAFSQINTGSLPVVLVTFSAILTSSQQVRLTWTTQQQFTTDIFEIEKSTDGLRWASIITMKSSGVSSKPVTYNAFDNAPLKGANFYRLRISSLDGSTGYTMAKNVNVEALGSIRIYPNPTASLINITLAEHPVAAYWNLSVINSMGQTVLQRRYHGSETKICLSVSNYPNGSYTLLIADGNSRQSNTLLINHN